MPPPKTLHALGSERGFCFVAEAHLWRANLSDPECIRSSLWKLLKAADLTVATASTLRELALKVPGGTPGRRAARFAKYGPEKTGLGARFRSSDVTQITVCRSRLVYTLRKIWEEAVRSPFDLLAIVLGLLLLVIIVSFGAIVDLAYRGRRSGTGYFASGVVFQVEDQRQRRAG